MVAYRESKEPFRPTRSLASYLLSLPIDFKEWRFAIGQVQAMFESHRYAACAKRCEKLLSKSSSKLHSTQASALHFYLALSIELSTRNIHHLHASKLSLLCLAKEHYIFAKQKLPDPVSTTESEPIEISEKIEADNLVTPPVTPTTLSRLSKFRSASIQPILREGSSGSQSSKFRSTSTVVTLLNNLPQLDKQHQRDNAFSPGANNWLIKCSGQRYNSNLKDFGMMLQKHVEDVKDLIKDTERAQNATYSGKKLLTLNEEETELVERASRIEQLKQRGWDKKRFNSEKYVSVVSRALEEVGTTKWNITFEEPDIFRR